MRALGGDTLHVDSAGTGDWNIGNPPYGPAIKAAAMRGYDLSPLRARQLNARDFDAFDLILAMDRSNLEEIEALRPKGSASEVALFLGFTDECAETEVPDPYFTRDFDGALDLIEVGARGLIGRLGA